MRTILVFSGVTLVVLAALLGRGLVDDTPPSKSSPPATAPPRTASLAPRPLPATAEPPRPQAREAHGRLFAALNAPVETVGEEAHRALVIAELEASGSGETQFREQGHAFGARLVADGLATEFRCFAEGCYVRTKPRASDPRIVMLRDELAPKALLAISNGAQDKFVVLVNYKEES